ncbi:MAG: methyltransferase domain-containing protein [Candidatus Latescibacterota bacterium]|nr:MAG: methyltransferase domain-containing protein [Candidatus Latescibacterota bacterium]
MSSRVKRDFANEDWDSYYRRYQRTLAEDYLIPILQQWNVNLRGCKFLEVGCGDGGCGAAFYGKGCDVVLMDIDERLVKITDTFNQNEKVAAKTYVGDVLDEQSPFYSDGPFDLVMFRDVIEHIENPERALAIVRNHLSTDGLVYVVFPPYYSPYGAHQQILPRKTLGPLPYNKLPYIQLLPSSLFLKLVSGESEANREVVRLSRIRLTIRGFERVAKTAGFVIRERRFFVSRPTFALRYGAPVIGAGLFGKVPLLREVLVTGAYFLLERADARRQQNTGHA